MCPNVQLCAIYVLDFVSHICYFDIYVCELCHKINMFIIFLQKNNGIIGIVHDCMIYCMACRRNIVKSPFGFLKCRYISLKWSATHTLYRNYWCVCGRGYPIHAQMIIDRSITWLLILIWKDLTTNIAMCSFVCN